MGTRESQIKPGKTAPTTGKINADGKIAAAGKTTITPGRDTTGLDRS